MDDLISRQAAIKYLMDNMNWYDEDGYESDEDYKRVCVTELINGVPSAQPTAEPVRHGKWMVTPTHIKCSECGESFMLFPQNYCPHCGARMDKDDQVN